MSGEEAGAAIDGATLRWIKGNCGLLAAVGALDGDFDALADAGSLCGGDGGEAFVLGLLAGLATLGFVPQSLVVKEDLLTGSPDKVVATVHTGDCAIFKFRLSLTGC